MFFRFRHAASLGFVRAVVAVARYSCHSGDSSDGMEIGSLSLGTVWPPSFHGLHPLHKFVDNGLLGFTQFDICV